MSFTPHKTFSTPSKSFGTSSSPPKYFGSPQTASATPSKSFGAFHHASPSKAVATPSKAITFPSKSPSCAPQVNIKVTSTLPSVLGSPRRNFATPGKVVHLTTSSPIKTVAEVAKKLFEEGANKGRNYIFISPSKRIPRRAPLVKIAERSEKLEPGGLCSKWESSHGKRIYHFRQIICVIALKLYMYLVKFYSTIVHYSYAIKEDQTSVINSISNSLLTRFNRQLFALYFKFST
jgi:hypothetical protein